MFLKQDLRLVSLVGCLMMLFSCSSDIEADPNMEIYGNNLGKLDEVELRKEISLLMGKVLLDKESRDYALDYARFKNDNSESISLATLAGNESKIPMEEKVALNKARKLNAMAEPSSHTFRSNLITTYQAMNGQLPVMQQMMQIHNMSVEGATASLSRGASSIFDSEAFAKHEVYFPYEEEFNWEKVDQFAMSWAPKNLERGSSDAHLFNVNTKTYSKEPIRVDDDYAYRKPVVLVMPIFDKEDWVAVEPPPYIPTNRQYWLTKNVDHTKINQKDVLRVNVAKIRVLKHLSGWPSKSKVAVYRIYGDLKLNSDGSINEAGPKKYNVMYRQNVSRKQVRKGRWVTVNALFDDDWDIHENDQNFVFASVHNWGGKAKVEGNVKFGYDEEKKKYSFNPEFKIDFDIELGERTRFRFNHAISRRGALSQIVGDFGNGTYNETHEGKTVKYHVRKAGDLQYFLKLHYTDVPE